MNGKMTISAEAGLALESRVARDPVLRNAQRLAGDADLLMRAR
jgi:hypothetical protein